MGGARSSLKATVPENPDRAVFVQYAGFQRLHRNEYSVFTLTIGYMRHVWNIEKRFSEISKLDKLLEKKFEREMDLILKPHSNFKNLFRGQDDHFLINRGREVAVYLQLIVDNKTLFSSAEVQEFLEIGPAGLKPDLGRKGKEGYVRVCSGGYTVKHSHKPEFLRSWKWRWVAVNDTQISIYNSRDGPLLATVQIDQALDISCAGKIVIIQTSSRKLSFMTSNSRFANEWVLRAKSFYDSSPRALPQPSGSSFPIRERVDTRVYTTCRDYYLSLAVSILRATETIFIAAYTLHPLVTLTRPPFPTIRLDQLLQLKAEQGVQILVSLNKESGSTIGYSSYKSEHTKKYLVSLNPNIEVIRHPGATKSSWSHHENIVIVDRNIAYVSCAELSYGNYDDANKSVDDEIGSRFPGPDFVQPHPSLHRPVRAPQNATSAAIGAPAIAPPGSDGIDNSSSGRFDRGDQPRHHQSFFTSPSALIDDDDDDATVAEPETAQEREARMAAERDDYAVDTSGAYPTFIGGEASRQASSRPAPDITPGVATQNPENVTGDPLTVTENGVFSSLFKNIGGHFSQALADIDALVTGEGKSKGEICLMYPRQPVHSVHAAVSGQAARDIAAHFTQRWNHSRLAKWEMDRTHVSDVTDIPNFGACPRCGASGLDESIVTCPPCGMSLGPKADFLCCNDSGHPHASFSPAVPDSFTCATYACRFMGQLGFSLTGDGPVIVHRLLKVSHGHGACSEGSLLSAQGPNVELLLSHSSLKATPGDILVAIDGITVTHLNTEELTRYIRHRKEFLSQQYGTDLTPMRVVFRRHYVEELHNLPSVVETDSTLYPVAEFEIVRPPQAAVAILPASDPVAYKNEPLAPGQGLASASGTYEDDTVASAPTLLEPVVPQPNGADAYGMAMALMDAMVTPMPLTPQNASSELITETQSSDRHEPTERVVYSHSEGVQVSDRTTSGISAPPAYNEAVVLPSLAESIPTRSTQPTADQSTGEIGGNVTTDIGVEFPEVPTGPVVVSEPQTVDLDYLTRYDLMPLAPTTTPVEARASEPVTGRREVERKAMALSGKAQPFRTRPFEPSTSADSPTTSPSASGFSEVSTSTSRTTLPSVVVDERTSISYPTPVVNSQDSGSRQHESVAWAAPLEPEPPVRNNRLPQSYEVPSEDDLAKNVAYPEFSAEAAPVATGVAAHPYNPTGSVRETNAQNCCIIQDIHENLQDILTPSPPPVPVAISASAADVHRINRRQMQHDRPGGVDPARLEKGKKRSLQLEKLLAMSQLFHDNKYAESTVASGSMLGHCHVQVLRSSSSWSTGAKKDNSIQSSWISAVSEAEKFIYIETSTLTGGPTAGADVNNGVMKAILEKIVSKAQAGQAFRVVIILPLLGVGNFLESEASRVVLQRQFMTICRGPNSLLYQFVQRVPGVDPSEFISFFSLRNWGVMNNRVVSEQVFVKSNIIIVDDRVVVLGSASVHDRGLLGDRNSEVAVRIEDTTHLDVIFDGGSWSVGFLPHMVRTELMRHHLSLPEADLTDPVSPGVYMSLLRGYAALNSGVYDELDGDMSVYRCRSIVRYQSLLSSKENRSYHDLRVREITGNIKGFLVFFPLDFLSESLPYVNGIVHNSGVPLHNLWV